MFIFKYTPAPLKWGAITLIGFMLVFFAGLSAFGESVRWTRSSLNEVPFNQRAGLNFTEQGLIRFHVIAHSDSKEDQALKWAVRDRILSELSPRLARSHSLAESRSLLAELRPEMERLAEAVVREQGYEYSVHTEFGRFLFPTKSYGSFVLPAGEYEALRVVIGQGQGANWWCVLFPPICFVDIEHSTAVPVDGKAPVPLKQEPSGGKSDANLTDAKPSDANLTDAKPVVKIWIWEKAKEILKRLA